MTENELKNLSLDGFSGVYTVYAHVNKMNKKSYIGQTCKTPQQRWHGGNGYCRNQHFYRSIQKYGWNEGFEHIIIANKLSVELADIIEIELIKKFDLINKNKGYNHHPGGHHSPPSKEAIEKVRKANTGRHPSEETKRKIRESKLGEKNPNYGKKMPQWHIDLLRSYTKGKKMSKEELERHTQICINARGYTVFQYTLDGKFVSSYGSVGDAARKNNMSISSIKNTCNHILRHCNGYIWLYENEGYKYGEDLPDYIVQEHKIHRQHIIQLDLEGNFIKEYQSQAEASKQTGTDRHGISKCCKGKQETAGGYKWEIA